MIFSINYHSMSGLKIRTMKIRDQSEYESHPWVRYITRSKDYSCRRY